jgi:hypothetical protein
MRRTIETMVLLAVVAAGGCEGDAGAPADLAGDPASFDASPDAKDVAPDPGPPDAADADATDPDDPGTDAPDVPDAREPLLRCISARVPDTHLPVVLRLAVFAASEGHDLHAVRGYQHAIQEPTPVDPDPRSWTALGTVADDAWDLAWEGGGLVLARAPVGPVLAGTLDLAPYGDLAIHCWAPGAAPPFAYDAATGRCLDGQGNPVRGGAPLPFVSETGQGQCADLAGVALEDADYYYPALADWDLRGADLTGAQLHFADLVDARLQGAILTDLDFGYARIGGTIDAFTVPPTAAWGGSCTVEGDRLDCWQ